MESERRYRSRNGGGQNEDSDNRFNRFDAENRTDGGGYRSQRPRFVRAESSGEHRYSKVERGGERREQGRPYGNDGQRGGYRRENQARQYPENNSGYHRNGGFDNREHGYTDDRNDQTRFYRERVQTRDAGNRERTPGRPYRQEQDGQNGQRAYGNRRTYGERDYSGQNRYGRADNGGARPFYRQENGDVQDRRRQFHRPAGNRKRAEYREPYRNPDEELRLNKYLANAGVCSRREADDFILAGVVRVNGEVVTELGTKVKRGDSVQFHDQPVNIEHKVYILLNKPKDCVTTVDDPQERKTVMDYVKDACKERIYPVGRLDRNTTGVLLLTNDGELTTRLLHPKYLKKKIYHARLDRNVSQEDMENLLEGVDLGGGDIVRADAVEYVGEDRSQVGIEIHSGRNRIVRRLFDALGYKVTRLDRVQFAGLTKKKLRRGEWRFLTEQEVGMLRMGAYE